MLNQEFPKDYVLSSGETHTIREFVEKTFNQVGIEGFWDFVNGNSPENEEFLMKNSDSIITLAKINPKFYRPAEVEILLGNSSAARNELKWSPKTSFTDLIKKMINHDLNEI